jgi:hypothetical protein
VRQAAIAEVAEKTDHGAIVEEAGDAEKRRQRRQWGPYSAARTCSGSTR